MSSNPASVPASPPPRVLTPEASNVLGWWWLAIVTTIVLLASMWPSIFPDSSAGGLASMSNYLLVIVVAVLLAVGAWCAYAFSRAQAWSAGAMRLTAMIGLGVGLAGIGYFLYSVAFAPASPSGHSFFGPAGVLTGIMWGLIILLPFIFGLTLIFGLMNDAVDEWFNPPLVYERTDIKMNIDPSMAAAMASAAMSGGAGSARATGDDELMGELSEAMSLTGKTGRIDGDQSIEVIGSAEDDLSVEVIGDKNADGSDDSMEELAALERALTKDVAKKGKPQKKETKPDFGKGDEPLKVDEDFKL